VNERLDGHAIDGEGFPPRRVKVIEDDNQVYVRKVGGVGSGWGRNDTLSYQELDDRLRLWWNVMVAGMLPT